MSNFDYARIPTDLDKVYAPLHKLYREQQDEIPVGVYKGYTITLRNSWSNSIGVYTPEGKQSGTYPDLFMGCAEVIRLVNDLDEFPHDSRFDVPTNKYYDEAVDLYLRYCDLAAAVKEQMRRDVICLDQ